MEARSSELTLAEAAKEFDAASVRAFEAEADEQRQETLRRYPLARWPEMTLEEYAQGQSDQPENYCRWIERQTDQMGSIRGGSARKLIIYKHGQKPGWYLPKGFTDAQGAWEEVRGAFLEAFELAEQDRWDEIDAIEILQRGPALLAKALWVYFPDKLLPITSSDNLRHFLRIAGREVVAADQSLGTLRLNRDLLSALQEYPELEQHSTKALERLLYMRFSPFEGRVIKIAPGRDAGFWEDCLAGGYMCVGWDEVGDLRQYESKSAFVEAFRASFRDKHRTPSKLTEKANELWTLVDIADGERIVANKGISEVLAVGVVESPGYVWDDSREEYKHTVRVAWDTDYAKSIPSQARWAMKTILPLQGKARSLVMGEDGEAEGGALGGGDATSTAPQYVFRMIAEALERKRQVILYGPPGTGKTWTAQGFARWWLERENHDGRPVSASAVAPQSALESITFHPSYSYEDFVEGFRPARADAGVTLRLEDGIFKSLCRRAAADPQRKYLLVIDEINRANVTKVLGELMTLLETDKRGRVSVRLPYSKEQFRIPPNLYLLGTMNTADRSIKLLDTALRRRFGFVELMPDPELLTGSSVQGLDLGDLLRELNRRIVKGNAGREKQIGHSFFMRGEQPIADADEFAQIFRGEIVPLLQEYAFDDYDDLAEYLGERIVDREALALRQEVLADPTLLIEALEEDLAPSAQAA